MSKHTPEPWLYRPEKHDDWGFIRDTEGHLCSIAKNSRITYAQENEYRANKKDPYEHNGRRIVACVNACAGMEDPAAEIAKLKAENERLINFVRLVESSVSAANPESVIGKAAKLLIEEMEAQK